MAKSEVAKADPRAPVALGEVLGKMSALARFKALQMRVDAVPPTELSEPLVAALEAGVVGPAAARVVLEISRQWEASGARRELAAEISRMVALAPPRPEGAPAELILPLWGYEPGGGYGRQGGAVRSTGALEGAALEGGSFTRAARFQGVAPPPQGEFDEWFGPDQYGDRQDVRLSPRAHAMRAVEKVAGQAVRRALGEKAWALLAAFKRGGSRAGAEPEGAEGSPVQLLRMAAWIVAEEAERLAGRKAQRGVAESDADMVKIAVAGTSDSAETHVNGWCGFRGAVGDVNLGGWLGAAFDKLSIDGSEWSEPKAEALRARGAEIFASLKGGSLSATAGEAAMMILGVWLGNELDKGDMAALRAKIKTVEWPKEALPLEGPTSLRRFAPASTAANIEAARELAKRGATSSALPASGSTAFDQAEPGEELAALTSAARKAAFAAESDLAQDALKIADARMGHWAASLGFETVGGHLAAGKWEELGSRAWAKEAAARRFARDSTVSGRVWAAMETASHDVGPRAARNARKILSVLGVGTQEVEELATAQHGAAFLACASAWMAGAKPADAKASQEDRQWMGLAHMGCLMRAFHADAASERPRLAGLADPAKAAECVERLRADPEFERASYWVVSHVEKPAELASKAEFDMVRAHELARAHEAAAGSGMRRLVARAAEAAEAGEDEDLGPEPTFMERWDALALPKRLDLEARGLLSSEGFAGVVAKLAASQGEMPKLIAGDARSRANAWLGHAKSFAQRRLGVGEAAWKWLRSQATPIEQLMALRQLRAGAAPLEPQGGRERRYDGPRRGMFDEEMAMRRMGGPRMMMESPWGREADPLRGLDGASDPQGAAELFKEGGPSERALATAKKAIEDVGRALDAKLDQELRAGPPAGRRLPGDVGRMMDMLNMLGVIDEKMLPEGLALAGDDPEADAPDASPMGMLLTRAAKTGKPMSLAMAASNFVAPFWRHVGPWSAMEPSWWTQALAPASEGAKISSAYAALEQEQRAREAKSETLLSAILERAGGPKPQERLAKLAELADWADAQAGRFWQELPEAFGWGGLERGSDAWHVQRRQQSSSGKAQSWRHMGADFLDEKTGLEAIELCDTQALAEEGNAMSHCVGSYGPRCAAGERRIFSVRKNGKRLATLEIAPGGSGLRIAQLKGQCNMEPTKEAKQAAEMALERAREAIAAKAPEGSPKEASRPMLWEPEGFDAAKALDAARKERAAARKERPQPPPKAPRA